MLLLNLTDEDISYHLSGHEREDAITLSRGRLESITVYSHYSHLVLRSQDSGPAKTRPCTLRLQFSLSLGASWQAIEVPAECKWKIYATRPSRNECQLTIFPKRNLDSFLSEMPDRLFLDSLLLPGTHDTMAFYGWMLSQCQSIETPLQVQLQNGIRVLDVRLAVVEGRLVAYHGIYPEKTPFQIILSTVFTFLTAPPSSRETIVMSVKQEDYATTPLPIFSRLVREEFITGLGGLDMLFLENRIPKLGEVRGKIVLLSRFGGNGAEWEHGLEGLGIHPMIWPDSEKDGFSWECKDVHVRVHDWYAIPSFLYIPEKVSIATKFLLPPASENKNRTLSIVYTSAASFPFAAPKTVALGFGWPKIGLGVEGINSRVGKWLLDAFSQPGANVNEKTCRYRMNEPRLRGWLLADFYDLPEHSLVDLLVECNFRGCNSEEEG